MELFLFIIKDKPGYRRSLHEAQAVLEDHFYDRGYNGVQWGDDGDERYGAWLADATGLYPDPNEPESRWSGQLIWPVTVPDQPVEQSHDLLNGDGAEFTLQVVSPSGKESITRRVTHEDWNHNRMGRGLMVTSFAVEAANSLNHHWSQKEST